MPTISIEQKLLSRLLAQHGLQHDVEQMAIQLPLLGTDIDTCDETHARYRDISLTDRTFCQAKHLAKAIRPFLHGAKSEPSLDVITGSIRMTVDPAELGTHSSGHSRSSCAKC